MHLCQTLGLDGQQCLMKKSHLYILHALLHSGRIHTKRGTYKSLSQHSGQIHIKRVSKGIVKFYYFQEPEFCDVDGKLSFIYIACNIPQWSNSSNQDDKYCLLHKDRQVLLISGKILETNKFYVLCTIHICLGSRVTFMSSIKTFSTSHHAPQKLLSIFCGSLLRQNQVKYV